MTNSHCLEAFEKLELPERTSLKKYAESGRRNGELYMHPTTQNRWLAFRAAWEAREAEMGALRRLVTALVDNRPDDMAADGVTVYDVWLTEARKALGR